MSLGTLRAMAQRRDLRPGRRRLRPLRGRRDLDGPALREDALRQRAAGPGLPARLAGDRATSASGACAARRSTGRCARCAGPRAASARALDADSEGVEGKFYVWTEAELRRRARRAATTMRWRTSGRVAVGGRAESSRAGGPSPRRCPEIRCKLYGARSRRVRPGLDDKRLTSWNALMVAALADAGAVLERADYLEAAVGCAAFVLDELRDDDGRLLRTWKDGAGAAARLPRGPRLPARGAAHPVRGHVRPALVPARPWRSATRIIERFADRERGGFFTTADDHERLAARRKDLEDSPIPSGNSAAAFGLLRLALLSGEGKYERHALGVLRLLYPLAAPPPARVRPPAPGRRLLSGARARGGDRRARRGEPLVRVVREPATPAPRAGRRRAPTACRCSRDASRSTAVPPRTSASTSSARRR